MQQAEMTNLINTVVKNQQNQYPTQSAIAQPSNTNANSNSKKPQSKMLNAVKEIAVTTGMGIAGGAAVGGITSLIPASNTGRVSDVLCDAFIKTADSDDNFDIAKKLNISLNNAETQIQKAKEYINAAKIFDNTELDTEQMKTAGKNLSDAAWALKQSVVDYIEQAVKDDGLLKFAKKEAKKMRAADLMISSIKTGIAAAFIVLLFNTVSSMFDKNNSQK